MVINKTAIIDFFRKHDFLYLDIVITVIFSLFWLWFAWQYGFHNSPDSWYRGVLGKSITAGQPYWINLKQGWLYEFGAWHHDATHEPFLPLIYAVYFLLFGNKIIIANFVSSISAGLLLLPLLRLSRALFRSPWGAGLIYFPVVLNKNSAFIFEVTAGLSLPTTLLLIVLWLWSLLRLLETNKKAWIWLSAFFLASLYLIRSDAQLLFFFLLFFLSLLAAKLLSREQQTSLGKMWLITTILILPWFLRKLIIFKNPFFSHITPMIWTDRGYDYWTYHENFPLPSPGSYFQTHSISDFLNKLFVQGPGNFYSVFQQVVVGPLWLYLLLAGISLALSFRYFFRTDRKHWFVLAAATLIFVGYFGLYSLVPILEVRYFIPLYFLLLFFIVSGPLTINQLQRQPRKIALWLFLIILAAGLTWQSSSRDYWRFAYFHQDSILHDSPLINSLKEKNFPKDAVILAPFAEGQRLAFATGLTYIEEPDNLKQLNDPQNFFGKYGISYSLVNLLPLLPQNMIKKIEPVGEKLLFTLDLEGKSPAPLFAQNLKQWEARQIRHTIWKGRQKKLIYFDGLHGAPPADLSALRLAGWRPYVSQQPLTASKTEFFQCGLLALNYAIGKPGFSREELKVVEQFIANGGSVLLCFPAWVWLAYDKKGLEHSPYQQIAGLFGFFFAGDYAGTPLKLNLPNRTLLPLGQLGQATYSTIIDPTKQGEAVLTDPQGRMAALRGKKGEAKILLWGQNNLFSETALGYNQPLIKGVVDWLLK